MYGLCSSEGENFAISALLIILVLLLVSLSSNWWSSERQQSTGQERACHTRYSDYQVSQGNFMVPDLLVAEVVL